MNAVEEGKDVRVEAFGMLDVRAVTTFLVDVMLVVQNAPGQILRIAGCAQRIVGAGDDENRDLDALVSGVVRRPKPLFGSPSALGLLLRTFQARRRGAFERARQQREFLALGDVGVVVTPSADRAAWREAARASRRSSGHRREEPFLPRSAA